MSLNHKVKVPYATRFEIALVVVLGCFNIALVAIMCELFDISSVIFAILGALLYLSEIALMALNHKKTLKMMLFICLTVISLTSFIFLIKKPSAIKTAMGKTTLNESKKFCIYAPYK